jgi:hypothetical protein
MALVTDPIWEDLRSLFAEKREQIETSFVAELLRSGPGGRVDEVKLAFYRGYVTGAQALLDNPRDILEELERLLELVKEGSNGSA